MHNLIPHFIHDQHQANRREGQFQAASLFVDVSGFTALTEQLMQRGKEGAETLTVALNSVFNPLVKTVYAYGGFISSFAGDAFTVLFPDEDGKALANAGRAGLEIQQFVRSNPVIHTPYGGFYFSVKVGLGVGEVQWEIIENSRQCAYYFRGAAINGCLEAESQAAAGQVIVPLRVMKQLSDSFQSEPVSDEFVRLIGAPASTMRQDKPVSLKRADLSPFVDETVLDAQPEFRHVATVFISFDGDQFPSVIAFIRAVMEAAHIYGGYFNKVEFGDKGSIIMLVFGAPVTHENDLTRVANFLLALREGSNRMRWRAGVTFGMVYAGFIGGDARDEYTVIGDTVNLAAREMSEAAWGEIWLNPTASTQLHLNGYLLETVGSKLFKGKSQPVNISRLVGRASRTDSSHYQYHLVGRMNYLTRLSQWLHPVFDKHFAGVMSIYGEAGMGKSRLVRELLTGAGALNWFFCPADEILRQSLNPFRYFLRRYFDQSNERSIAENKTRFDFILEELIQNLTTPQSVDLRRELDRTRSFLGALVELHWEGSLYEQIDAKLRFENTLVAFKTLVLAESLRKPVILHLEDAHWLDSDSQELLKVLTRNVSDYGLAVLLTSRYQDNGEHFPLSVDEDVHQEKIDLSPLSADNIRQLVAQVISGTIDDSVIQLLAKKSTGNPFFAEQLVLDLRERRLLTPAPNGSWIMNQQQIEQLPSNINAVLVARLDRLATQIKTVVQTAAVLGQEFEVRVLSAMLHNENDLPAKVQQAQKESIWNNLSEIRYIFRHALLRDAAYEMQLRTRLRDLHALAADSIQLVYREDLSAYYADLVYHFNRSGNTEKERQYAILVGNAAEARYANSEAVTYYTRALELVPKNEPEQRYQILKAREKIYELQAARELQSQDLNDMSALAERLDEDPLRAEIALRRSRYAEVTGDFTGMAEAAQQAIQLLPDDPDNLAMAHFAWGAALLRLADYVHSREELELAVDLAKRAGLTMIQADALRSIGSVHLHQGGYHEGINLLKQAVELYGSIGNLRGQGSCFNNLGGLSYNLGNYAEALEWMERAMEVFHQMGDRYGESITTGNIGSVNGMMSDPWKATTYLARSIQLSREIGNRMAEVHAMGNLGAILLILGDLQGAEPLLQSSLVLAQAVGERQRMVNSYASLSMLRFLTGNYAQSLQYGDQALQLAIEIVSPNYEALARTLIGLTLEATGHDEDVDLHYQAALDLDIQQEELHLAAEPRAGLARLALRRGNLSKAMEYVNTILTHLETSNLDGTSEPVRIYLSCYRVLVAANDPRAADVLAQGRAYMNKIADRITDDTARKRYLENIAAHREFLSIE